MSQKFPNKTWQYVFLSKLVEFFIIVINEEAGNLQNDISWVHPHLPYPHVSSFMMCNFDGFLMEMPLTIAC